MVGGCARVIFGHGEAQTRQGECGGGSAHPQGVAVQQLPVERPSHQHLAVGVVGGADLKRPPHVSRCQRERHLGGRRRASYVGLGGREGDPTIINPETPSEHLKMVQRGWRQGYVDTPQQPALVSRYQGGTELVFCPPKGTQRRGKDQEGATGKVAPPPHLPVAARIGVAGQDHGHPPADRAVLCHADGRVGGDVELWAVVVLVQDHDGHLRAQLGEGRTWKPWAITSPSQPPTPNRWQHEQEPPRPGMVRIFEARSCSCGGGGGRKRQEKDSKHSSIALCMPEVTKERATSATISPRKCSHRPGDYRPTRPHTNGRGRALLFPGLYLWGPPSPQVRRGSTPRHPGGSPGRAAAVIVGDEWKPGSVGSAARGSPQLDVWDWSCPPRR